MQRLKRDAEQRSSLYCTGEQHVSIIDPIYPYSGEPHEIELTACDCPKAKTADGEAP